MDKDKRELQQRIGELERRLNEQQQTINKMLPTRRQALKGAGLLAGGGLLGGLGGSAAASTGSAGQIGTTSNRPDVYADTVSTNEIGLNVGASEETKAYFGQVGQTETNVVADVSDGKTTLITCMLVAGANNVNDDGYYQCFGVYHDGFDSLATTQIAGGGDISTANTGLQRNGSDIEFVFDSGAMNFGPYYLVVRRVNRS